jgi:hypothetical protein
VKKTIFVLVLLGAAFCLYAQKSDDSTKDSVPAGAGDFGNAPLPAGSDKAGSGGFVDTLLDYFNDPGVSTRHLDRKRIVDIKLGNAEGRLGNNLMSAFDLLKKQIVINLDELNDGIDENGVGFGLDLGLQAVQFDINPLPRWGGGLGVGMAGRFDLALPKELLDLIAKGNVDNPVSEGEFAVSGSVFYEIGFNFHATLPALDGKLTIGVSPAYFSPLLYIDRSELGYKLDTDNKLSLSAEGKFTAYTPVNYDEIKSEDFFKSGGVDLSLSAEYALFTRLDVGLVISHIPLAPATLDTGYVYTLNMEPVEITDVNNIPDDLFDFDDIFQRDGDFGSQPAISVRRPLRFDLYGIFRPLTNDLLSIRPNVGFTTLNASEETYFNIGGRFNLELGRTFALYVDSGREEGFWRHKAGFSLNLRVLEVGLEAGLRSQNYIASWSGSGLSVKLGLALGF